MSTADLETLPRTLEAVLSGIARHVMNLAEVSLDGDLFAAYGLQSLAAVRIVLAAQAEDINVSIADLYKHRTIRAIARHVTDAPPPTADEADEL
ncbi:MAG: acyl carrier protein [Proteobacteria bacterium]|nr:acyl carrier protein [Pseudomonadota bacterium]